MNHELDIIYFTLFPWENAYSSVSLSFTREFAKHNRVFYINHPYSAKDFLTKWNLPITRERRKFLLQNKLRYETIPELPKNVRAVQPPLTFPINWLPPGKTYDRLHAINNRIILKTIRQLIKDFQIKNYIYLNCFNPYYAGVLPKNEFSPKLNIYQCVDDMNQEPYTARHGARLEEAVLRKTDIALVTSRNLLKLKSPLNPNTYILHNAVDLSIFKRALQQNFPRPKELIGLKTKLIGFTGNMDPNRIDFQLIKQTALAHKDKTLVLVGPLNSDEYKIQGLNELPNIILTGGKHIRELPAYLQHFDCTIIPFLANKLTESIYPLKINEYLAAGKSIVSTNFSEDIRSFSKDIYLANNGEEFVQLIDKAIAENTAEKIARRLAAAENNSWTERVRQFWNIVNRHLGDAPQKIDNHWFPKTLNV